MTRLQCSYVPKDVSVLQKDNKYKVDFICKKTEKQTDL